MASLQAVFFDEGPGFFLIRVLGQGVTGSACLVRSSQDGELYVRKEELSPLEQHRSPKIPATEIKNALLVKSIPGVAKVKGWVNYQDNKNGRVFPVSYWSYCNAGTLHTVITEAEKTGRYIPETWVCEWFSDMLSIILNIHQKGLTHNDGHEKNWFMHRSQNCETPLITLGDFGHSTISAGTPDWPRRCYEDFCFIQGDVARMLGMYVDQHGKLMYSRAPNRSYTGEMINLIADMSDILRSCPRLPDLNRKMARLRDDLLHHADWLRAEGYRTRNGYLAKPYVPTGDFVELKHMMPTIERNSRAFKKWCVANVQRRQPDLVKLTERPRKFKNGFKIAAEDDWIAKPGNRKYKIK
ncbi:hypothetical protein H2198_010550 [Neophaeococcomyces mojaviensis]|uniref:Uncharacterized protein n=1 Tax=Neophaeococcomyces mojaviensis TaxID=3383035 RepID=A0ACC2ZRI1_9EURO|nr:hypothetical protein H2198_010550 [Knufia sp. JES_112]